MVKRLRRKIRKNYNRKGSENNLEKVNAAVKTELYEGRSTGTQTEPILTQPFITQEEQHAVLVDVAIQIEDVPSCSMATQMEVWTSHNKEIQTKNILSHSISTQTSLQAKYVMTHNDPIILNLQEELAQA